MWRSLLLVCVWTAAGLPVGLFALPWTLLRRNASLLYRWGVGVGRLGLAAAGIRVQVRTLAPLPDTACLFLVNHASNLDPPLLASVLPRRAAMMVKHELWRVPLLGMGMRLAGFVPVARSGSVEDARRSLARAAAVLGSGLSLVIFVEGTRSPDGRLLPFKKGPFFLAMESGVPVVPVTIAGTHAVLPKGSLRIRLHAVDVTLHPPLLPQDFADRDALREAVRTSIASALSEMR